MSQQFRARMNSKLALIHQIDAKLASPIRKVLANMTTKPRLNLPLSSPNDDTVLIKRLKEAVSEPVENERTITPEQMDWDAGRWKSSIGQLENII